MSRSGMNENISIEVVGEPGGLKVVQDLAWKIFPKTYEGLIPDAQIPYMMQVMYDDCVMQKEYASGVKFAIIKDKDIPIGYISWHTQNNDEGQAVRLEKLYLDFAYHCRGIGNMALKFILDLAGKSGASFISLNVNKQNVRAQKAYLRAGFYRWREEKEPVGNGFFKDDYVMRYDLTD